MMQGVDVELLVVSDCPHAAAAHELLRTALDDVGLRRVPITTTVVDTQELAVDRAFIGSPTILVNGHDSFSTPGRPAGLACRVYDSESGPSGLPDLRALRQALKREAASPDTRRLA
jgi:hypothetical protein